MPVAKRSNPRKPAFLAAYAATASITKAAKAAKCERGLHYRWLKDDAEYPALFAAAGLEAGDLLEDEAIRRAHEGVNEPLIYRGQFSYRQRLNKKTGKLENFGKPLAVNKKSNDLMMFLLKGFKSEKYRDRVSAELSGPAGGPIVLADTRFADLDDDELAGLIAVSKKLKPE